MAGDHEGLNADRNVALARWRVRQRLNSVSAANAAAGNPPSDCAAALPVLPATNYTTAAAATPATSHPEAGAGADGAAAGAVVGAGADVGESAAAVVARAADTNVGGGAAAAADAAAVENAAETMAAAMRGPPCAEVLADEGLELETRLQLMAQYDPGPRP